MMKNKEQEEEEEVINYTKYPHYIIRVEKQIFTTFMHTYIFRYYNLYLFVELDFEVTVAEGISRFCD